MELFLPKTTDSGLGDDSVGEERQTGNPHNGRTNEYYHRTCNETEYSVRGSFHHPPPVISSGLLMGRQQLLNACLEIPHS